MDASRDAELKVFAAVLYELRVVLGAFLENSPQDLRYAAHLAYAVHNNALAVMEGKGFDAYKATGRIEYVDTIVGGDDAKRLASQIRSLLAANRTSPPNAGSD